MEVVEALKQLVELGAPVVDTCDVRDADAQGEEETLTVTAASVTVGEGEMETVVETLGVAATEAGGIALIVTDTVPQGEGEEVADTEIVTDTENDGEMEGEVEKDARVCVTAGVGESEAEEVAELQAVEDTDPHPLAVALALPESHLLTEGDVEGLLDLLDLEVIDEVVVVVPERDGDVVEERLDVAVAAAHRVG